MKISGVFLCTLVSLATLIPVEVSPKTWHVKVDGSGDAPTLQAAVDSAGVGDVVLVGPGRYTWTNQGTGTEYGLVRVLRGKIGFEFRSEAGPEATILDAEGQGRVMFVQAQNDIVIDGFTITGGVAPEFNYYWGGGIVLHITPDVIRNCIFTQNSAVFGGALWAGSNSTLAVESCEFYDNHAELGGAIGLINSTTPMTIRDCVIRDNTASDRGGGVFAHFCMSIFENTVISHNTAFGQGGGLYAQRAMPVTLTGCTFSENNCPSGSGIFVLADGILSLDHSIVAFGYGGAGLSVEPGGQFTIGCSDIFGNAGGDQIPPGAMDTGGNFTLDPQFCGSLGSRNFLLQGDSPCAAGNHPQGSVCSRVGAFGPGCGSVPVQQRTWGNIKARYLR